MYHHPVHKVSFIAQDGSDGRAFGYVFGSPEGGHRFFGVKTEKASAQVVTAMRELFQVVFREKNPALFPFKIFDYFKQLQVVFERKKREIERAKRQLSTDVGGGGGVPVAVASPALEAS